MPAADARSAPAWHRGAPQYGAQPRGAGVVHAWEPLEPAPLCGRPLRRMGQRLGRARRYKVRFCRACRRMALGRTTT